MATVRPLVVGANGGIQEMANADTFANPAWASGGSGGGSASVTSVVVDLGAIPRVVSTVTVADAAAVAGAPLLAFADGSTATGAMGGDDLELAPVSINAYCAVTGTITFVVTSIGGMRSGRLGISYTMGLATLTRKQPAPNSCANLLVYYGYPIAYLGLWDASAIITRIASQYSIWVVGDTYQDPAFSEYASTQTIIHGVRALGVKVYGYVPIGGSAGANRTMAALQTAVDQWAVLNVDGILLDEFGFDYGHDRTRQKTIVDYCHAKGLPICANAWTYSDFMADNINELVPASYGYNQFQTGNPTNIPLIRWTTDTYLLENFMLNNSGTLLAADFEQRVMAVLAFAANKEPRIWGLCVVPQTGTAINYAVLPPANLKTQDGIAKAAWAYAHIFALDAFGINGYAFGSSGSDMFEFNRFLLPAGAGALNARAFDAANAITTGHFGEATVNVTHATYAVRVTRGVSLVDEYESPALGTTAWWAAVGNDTTATAMGIVVTGTGTATAASVALTNVHTATKRLEYAVTPASTSAVAGLRQDTAQYALGDPANRYGGFHFSTTFGLSRGSDAGASRRMFAGMTSITAAPTDVEPSTWAADAIGVGADAADANWQIMHCVSTNAMTKVDTGLAKNDADAMQMYTLNILAQPQGGQSVTVRLTRLSDGVYSERILTTNLPAVTQLLAWQLYASVGGVSSVIGVAVSNVYIKTQ
jgi:hypothetical protein